MSGLAWKRIHFVFIFVFLGLWAAAGLFGWLSSVTFVSHVSMAALVLAEISSWQSSRTEQKQDKQIEQNEKRDDEQDDTLGIDSEENLTDSK